MSEEIVPTIQSIMQSINRKFGAGTIGVASKVLPQQISRIGTGSAKLDEALGGGFPVGRMVELYGPEHSGKSLISLLTIKQAQKQGLDCIYVDAEGSFDPVWTTKIGVDVSKVVVTQMSVAEDVVDTVAKLLEAKPGIIVVDSVAGLITRSELEEDADQQFMAPKARIMSRSLAKLNALNKNQTLIIWVNQIRSTLALYGSPVTTPGGNSLKHWASVRVEVKRDSNLITESGKKTDEKKIGQIVDWKIVKNKTAAPYGIGSFKLFFDGHIEE